MDVLGIDISKRTFQAALSRPNGKWKQHTFPNSGAGFSALFQWLAKQEVTIVHACMESTGGYGDALATFLWDHGNAVSVVNPSRIKAFGGSELVRTKTDASDASVIARFCASQKPELWQPPSESQRALQGLVRRRSDLLETRTQEALRLQAPTLSEQIRPSIEHHIAFLDQQLADIDKAIQKIIHDDPDLRNRNTLLLSIPGIGERGASSILGEMPNIEEFRDGKAVAAYAGLSPRHNQSGTFAGRSRLSKIGNAHLRHALFFPAMAAMRYNPILRPFAQRLRARGKRAMVIVAAVMRRLLVLAYGVLKSGRAFSPA